MVIKMLLMNRLKDLQAAFNHLKFVLARFESLLTIFLVKKMYNRFQNNKDCKTYYLESVERECIL